MTVRLLAIVGDSPWPAHDGGSVRTAGLLEALSSTVAVRVLVLTGVPREAPVDCEWLGCSRRTGAQLRLFAGQQPRLGRTYFPQDASAGVLEAVARYQPTHLFFPHSYLAASAPRTELPMVVDFANIEIDRFRSFVSNSTGRHRVSAAFELLKARRWEPAVARRAHLAIAISSPDEGVLAGWGAKTARVPNAVVLGMAGKVSSRSPEHGPVVYVSSSSYQPNAAAGHWLISQVWPQVRRMAPDAQLVLAGRGSSEAYGAAASEESGITVLGEVPEVDSLLQTASLVAAPVTYGAGRQLKVAQALVAGRVVISTSFSAQSVPPELLEQVLIADDASAYAAHLAALLKEPARRHLLEHATEAARLRLPGWRELVEPVVCALERKPWGGIEHG